MSTKIARVAAFLAILCSTAVSLNADDSLIQWRGDLETAEEESHSTGKPMLVQLTASWCTFCHKMLQTTCQDQQVADLVNAKFIPVLVDADRRPKLVEALKIKAFPSTVIVSSDFQKVLKIAGYQKAGKFKSQLTEIASSMAVSSVKTVASENAAPAQTASIPEATVVAEEIKQPEPAPQPKPFAFGQKCLASIVDERKLIEGKEEFALEYHGKSICFASAEARENFLQSPEKYWPVNDGRSPVNIENQEGNPVFGASYSGKIYFCASQEELDLFKSNPRDFAK